MLKLLVLFLCFTSNISVKGLISDLKPSEVSGDKLRVRERLHDENDRPKRSDDSGPLASVVDRLSQEVNTLTAKLEAAENTLRTEKGSTFIRWGRTNCPSGSQVLYSGIAGGSDYGDSGSGSNRLCLNPDPVFDGTVHMGATASLTGAQYFINGHGNTDAVCAVCYTPHSATFMVPGTNRCPAGTVLQYHGHVTASQRNLAAQAEYVCLDVYPEDRPGTTARLQPSAFFMHAIADCGGTLPCPPYRDGKVVTCAVCSK